MNFACNQVPRSALSEMVGRISPAVGAKNWGLVDPTLIGTDEFMKLASRRRWKLQSTLEASHLQSYGPHAPQLVEFSARDTTVDELELAQALRPAAPALSVLRSRTSLGELRELLAWLAFVRVDDDMDVHCRFADTRVLPSLLGVLSQEQRRIVSRVVDQWLWVDRFGDVAEWKADGGETSEARLDISGQMQIDKAQFGRMLSNSEPDTMFSLLIENTPELVPEHRRGQFFSLLSSALSGADERKLLTPNDRLQFVILSLSCGPDFHLHHGLESTWSAIRAKNATLEGEMKSWSDQLWDALQTGSKTAVA